MVRAGLALAGALVGVLLTGCSGGGSPEQVAVEPVAAGLSGKLVAYRDDVLRRVVSVQMSADAPVLVRQVRVETAAYNMPQPGPAGQVQPGLPVDLRVPYGAVRCDAADAGATAVVSVDGGADVRVPLADSAQVLERLRAAECAQQALGRQVALSLSGVRRTGPDTTAALLRVRRSAGDAPVRVTELGRSTLLAPSAGPPGGPVLVLPPGAAAAEVEVTVRPARCDPHALAESKRSTAFRVFVQLADSPPLLVLVEPSPPDRDALVAFVVDACVGRG